MYHGERLNCFTHLVGTVASAIGLAGLVYIAVEQGDVWKIVSFTLYGITLFLLYLISTLYHGARGRAQAVLQKLDHFAIYLLIAGSYTPLTLVTLAGTWGWSLFAVIWGLAILGIVVDAYSFGQQRIIPMMIYLIMGWLVLVALYPLAHALPFGGLAWLFVGGFFYTVGIIFYLRDEVMEHAHGIWHLFVLAGSASHYVVVANYI